MEAARNRRTLPSTTAEAGGWERSGGGTATTPERDEEQYDQPVARDTLPRPEGFDDDRDSIEDGDREAALGANVRRYVAILERYIRAYPEQWYCFYPFWEDPSRTEAALPRSQR